MHPPPSEHRLAEIRLRSDARIPRQGAQHSEPRRNDPSAQQSVLASNFSLVPYFKTIEPVTALADLLRDRQRAAQAFNLAAQLSNFSMLPSHVSKDDLDRLRDIFEMTAARTRACEHVPPLFACQRLARLAAQPSFRCAPSLCEAWVTNRSYARFCAAGYSNSISCQRVFEQASMALR